MGAQRIIVVEDEPDIRAVMEHHLKREGFDVRSCGHGGEALELVREFGADLVLLDLMLPGVDGIEVCRRLRSDPLTKAIPILIVSAKGEESDVVIGLGVGADDYVTKPFSPKVLVARVRAVLRRGFSDARGTTAILQFGALKLLREEHRATLEGADVGLTATEFRILWELASQPGRVFTRDLLITRALGDHAAVGDRTIDAHIRAIRSKLKDSRDLVQTRRGVGYTFTEDA